MSDTIDDLKNLNLIFKDQLDVLIRVVSEMGASDIIFKTGDPVWARLHGRWKKVFPKPLTEAQMNAVTVNISGSQDQLSRILSGQDIDIAYEIKVDRLKKMRFRVNATAAQFKSSTGICITLRTIPEHPPKLDDLNIPQEMRDAFFPKYGLCLVTGPVGSGKSTLLFSVLREIAENTTNHIITYEAPIEFNITDLPNRKGPVEQTEIGRHLKDFKNAPRNSLRRAGDVVLFGESRDPETIRAMSIEAETGVAVYSTVHTNSVAETISRMVREFPVDERSSMMASLLSAMRLIVHQRLIVKPDGNGRTAVREWLVFNEDVVSRLENCALDEIITETRNIMKERGTRLIDDLVKQYKSGNISKDEMRAYSRSLGISREEAKAIGL